MHKTKQEEAVTSLHDLSAHDLIAGYKTKQFSPSEVLEDVIAHVARWEPHIKALYAFDPDGARKLAKASTDRWQKGEPNGTLDGVPVPIGPGVTLHIPAGVVHGFRCDEGELHVFITFPAPHFAETTIVE
mgnify:CR=1 FL=1